MRQAVALASTALLAFAASWVALASLRPASPAAPPADPPPASSPEAGPDRLMARIAARLDEIGQVRDDLNDQETAVAKADLALAVARRDSEIAGLALREYDEATYPQELALAEGELALAEGELRLLDDPSRRPGPPPEPRDPDRAAPKPSASASASPDAQALARARLTRDLALSHREALVRRTRPRRVAELRKEEDRARADLKLKESALLQERADLARLRGQLRDASLSDEERAAIAAIDGPGGLDRASTLWAGAERSRAEKLRAAALDRARKSLEGPTPR